MKHFPRSGPDCAFCNEKMRDAHEILQNGFRLIKAHFQDCHVSWAFRNEEQQNDVYASGKSRAKWPTSPHNKKPSRAMDLFQIRESDGVAQWRKEYFEQIADLLKAAGQPIFWGGRWSGFSDPPHFQIALDQE